MRLVVACAGLVLTLACGRVGFDAIDSGAEADARSIDAPSDATAADAPPIDARSDATAADAPPIDAPGLDAPGSDAPIDATVIDASSCVRGTHAGHDYAYCAAAVPYDEAVAECARMGMSLAIVGDDAENAFLLSIVAARGWIGATDRRLEGTWEWGDGTIFYVHAPGGGTPVGGAYLAWGAAEPNGGMRESCAAFLPPGAVWIDYPCTELAGIVCESSP